MTTPAKRRLVLAVAFVVAGCGQTPAELADANGCVTVPAALVEVISTGLKVPGVTIGDTKAVGSPRHSVIGPTGPPRTRRSVCPTTVLRRPIECVGG